MKTHPTLLTYLVGLIGLLQRISATQHFQQFSNGVSGGDSTTEEQSQWVESDEPGNGSDGVYWKKKSDDGTTLSSPLIPSATDKRGTEAEDDDVHYGVRRLGPTGYIDSPIIPMDQPTGPPFIPTPTRTIPCPGPVDCQTGQGVLIDGKCQIICYNNLVLVGNDCTCPTTYHLDHDKVQCVCKLPRVESKGKCVLKPSQYPCPKDAHRKRSLPSQLTFGDEASQRKHVRSQLDIENCPSGEIACRLPTGGFQCIEPDNDLENCGGCPGEGVDCTRIEGVKSVGCLKGSCVILSCAKGFKPQGQTCVKKTSLRRK